MNRGILIGLGMLLVFALCELTACTTGISQEQYNKVNNDLTEAKVQAQLLQNELGLANAEVTLLQTKMSAADNEIALLKKNLSTTESDVTLLRDHISLLQNQRTQDNDEITSLQNENTDLRDIVGLKKSTVVADAIEINEKAGVLALVKTFTTEYAGQAGVRADISR